MNVSTAWVGVGGNLGEPLTTVPEAIDALADSLGVENCTRSSLYRTAPRELETQPDFINAVACVETTLTPLGLLNLLQEIENRFGRLRDTVRFGPRKIDLDLLIFGELIIESKQLTVPHPRMHERGFVLGPLYEIAPGLTIPGCGSVSDLLAKCSDQRVSRVEQADRSANS